MQRIFHDPYVKTSLHIDIKFDNLAVFYFLINPIRSRIFNFNKFVNKLDVKAFLRNNYIFLRNYEGSDVIDKDNNIQLLATWGS